MIERLAINKHIPDLSDLDSLIVVEDSLELKARVDHVGVLDQYFLALFQIISECLVGIVK